MDSQNIREVAELTATGSSKEQWAPPQLTVLGGFLDATKCQSGGTANDLNLGPGELGTSVC